MHYRFLVTGTTSGIGKFLLKHLPDSRGLDRTNFPDVERDSYGVIIHCAFNKSRRIDDDYQYLDDNIFLTKRIIDRLDFRAILYLSSVDVYQEPPTPYSLCKRFAEALVSQCKDYTILRCSTLLGAYMKPNHLTGLLEEADFLGLSGESSFNYILYDDLLDYFLSGEAGRHPCETVDFVSDGNLSLKQVKEIVGSNTMLGDARYAAPVTYTNPIYRSNGIFHKTSEENLRRFLAGRQSQA